MRLHLVVGEAAQMRLEVLEVVDGATAVRRRNDLLGVLANLGGDSAPGGLDCEYEVVSLALVKRT